MRADEAGATSHQVRCAHNFTTSALRDSTRPNALRVSTIKLQCSATHDQSKGFVIGDDNHTVGLVQRFGSKFDRLHTEILVLQLAHEGIMIGNQAALVQQTVSMTSKGRALHEHHRR